jgi:hypothetical protein
MASKTSCILLAVIMLAGERAMECPCQTSQQRCTAMGGLILASRRGSLQLGITHAGGPKIYAVGS